MQKGNNYAAEVAAAYNRVMYLKERHLDELKAIRRKELRPTRAEAATLKELAVQHRATLSVLNYHKAGLLVANDRKFRSQTGFVSKHAAHL